MILEKITIAIIQSELTVIKDEFHGVNPDDQRIIELANIIFHHPNNRFEKDILSDANKAACTILRMFNFEGLVISRKRKNAKAAS